MSSVYQPKRKELAKRVSRKRKIVERKAQRKKG